LDRLIEQDRFTEPKASAEATALMADLASPVNAFIRERCDVETDTEVDRDVLYRAWHGWALDNGHQPGAKNTFGRDLRAVMPGLQTRQVSTITGRARHYVGIRLKATVVLDESC
jgi:putative DNA primase/helicase